jgi:hypothetical protein
LVTGHKILIAESLYAVFFASEAKNYASYFPTKFNIAGAGGWPGASEAVPED